MKTLVIYPGKSVDHDSPFHILDPETGECLASHFCSGSWYAKSDLHDGRPERKKEWQEKYGMETEAKFIEETDYIWEEVYTKNQSLKEEEDGENIDNRASTTSS